MGIRMRTLLFATAVALACGNPAPSFAMAPTPPTSYPSIIGCSAQQEAYLKTAWRRAHQFVWRADQLLDHIADQPAASRSYLWSLDYEHAARSTSPRT